MTEISQHRIAENSCFFQGHPGQLFTKHILSFKIKRIFESDDEDRITISKFKHMIASSIIERIAERNRASGTIDQIQEKDLQILPIKLLDSSTDGNLSGIFEFYPKTALCTEEGCNRYFVLKGVKGKLCGHSNSNWEQITFIAFCDDCGRRTEISESSNLGKNCKKCGRERSMTKLRWRRRDDLLSYKVICESCGNKDDLFFFPCNHIDIITGKTLFIHKDQVGKDTKGKVRGVPAKANTVIHAAVLTTPDISEPGEIDIRTGKVSWTTKRLSASFAEFFPNIEESKFRLPELMDALKNDDKFRELKKVSDFCEDFGLEKDIRKMSEKKFKALLRKLLIEAKDILDTQREIETSEFDKSSLRKRFGIDIIHEKMEQLKDTELGEEDFQAMNLLEIRQSDNENEKIGPPFVPKKSEFPKSLESDEFDELLKKYGLSKIIHISSLTMVQSLLGIIEGSTRNEPPLFNVIYVDNKRNKKPTVYIRSFSTEGIVFQLDYETVLKWLYENNKEDNNLSSLFLSSDNSRNFEIVYRKIISNKEKNYENQVYELLHTFSHMLIQQSTIHTGLDIQSLAEKIYPKFGMVFIYSTSSINIGGLESTFDLRLDEWMHNMSDLALDCPQDPGCMIDENGACNACCVVPEFVCERFNNKLDRSTLVGNSNRFRHGYLKI